MWDAIGPQGVPGCLIMLSVGLPNKTPPPPPRGSSARPQAPRSKSTHRWDGFAPGTGINDIPQQVRSPFCSRSPTSLLSRILSLPSCCPVILFEFQFWGPIYKSVKVSNVTVSFFPRNFVIFGKFMFLWLCQFSHFVFLFCSVLCYGSFFRSITNSVE